MLWPNRFQLYRSGAQMCLTATAARTSNVIRKHHALARRLLDRQDDYLRFTNQLANTRRGKTAGSVA
jgi:hypothetical protein